MANPVVPSIQFAGVSSATGAQLDANFNQVSAAINALQNTVATGANGNVVIPAASSGTTLTVNGASGSGTAVFVGSPGTSGQVTIQDGQTGLAQWTIVSGANLVPGQFGLFLQGTGYRFQITPNGDFLARGIALVDYLSAQFPIISSITLTNVGLGWTSLAPGSYRFKCGLYFAAVTTSGMGLQVKLNASNLSGNSWVGGYGVVNNSAVTLTGLNPVTSVNQFASVAQGSSDYLILEGSFTLSAASSVQIQCAQKTSTASNLIIQDRSFLEIVQLS
jgi:hypothetical protein